MRSSYLLPPLVLSAWAHAPTTANHRPGDDFQHRYAIADGRVPEFPVTPHDGHMLVARNALFVLSYTLFGVDSRGDVWIALLTHLVHVGLLYALIVACSDRWSTCATRRAPASPASRPTRTRCATRSSTSRSRPCASPSSHCASRAPS